MKTAPENPIQELRLANLRFLFHESPDLSTKLWAMAEFLRIARAEFLAAKFATREARYPEPPSVPVIGERRGCDPFGEEDRT